MFKNTNFIYLILALTLTFISCKKEELLKPDNTNYVNEDTSLEGITWVLAEGRIYRENLTNYKKDVFDHFSSSKVVSCMNIFGPGATIMDTIKQNYTTWFFSNGQFILNGVNNFNYTVYNDRVYTPIGLNGTARPIEVLSCNGTVLTVKIHEAFGSDGIDNYKWYSELVFIKAGTTCNNCQSDVRYGYTYSGVWTSVVVNNVSISGTKWVVVRYNNGLSGNVYPNDTLDFISQSQYKINGGSVRNYTLSNVIGNNNKSLSLYSFSTLGGDYSGEVIGTFVDDYAINNSQFVDMFNVNNTVTVWMSRIQ